MTSTAQSDALVRVEALTKTFVSHESSGGKGMKRLVRGQVRAVDGLTLVVREGEALGIVGESGSGKTTAARCLLRLIKPTSGSIFFQGLPVLQLSRSQLKAFRRHAQIVFQDPFASLDPRFTVTRALAEPLRVHKICKHSEFSLRAASLLHEVGLNDELLSRYRHELSGGEAQRVSIARALATRPRFLILDEPTSALDASARLHVISLLQQLRASLGITYLVISHDLSTIRRLCDRVIVMYRGQVVEEGQAEDLFRNPQHPYTEALLSATPTGLPTGAQGRIRLRSATETQVLAEGCTLAPRCHYATDECVTTPQALKEIADGHSVACHRVSEGQIALRGTGWLQSEQRHMEA